MTTEAKKACIIKVIAFSYKQGYKKYKGYLLTTKPL
jgi:hypothetical protein